MLRSAPRRGLRVNKLASCTRVHDYEVRSQSFLSLSPLTCTRVQLHNLGAWSRGPQELMRIAANAPALPAQPRDRTQLQTTWLQSQGPAHDPALPGFCSAPLTAALVWLISATRRDTDPRPQTERCGSETHSLAQVPAMHGYSARPLTAALSALQAVLATELLFLRPFTLIKRPAIKDLRSQVRLLCRRTGGLAHG